MDVDRIQRDMDVKTLQDNIMHITFCNIEAELVGELYLNLFSCCCCQLLFGSTRKNVNGGS